MIKRILVLLFTALLPLATHAVQFADAPLTPEQVQELTDVFHEAMETNPPPALSSQHGAAWHLLCLRVAVTGVFFNFGTNIYCSDSSLSHFYTMITVGFSFGVQLSFQGQWFNIYHDRECEVWSGEYATRILGLGLNFVDGSYIKLTGHSENACSNGAEMYAFGLGAGGGFTIGDKDYNKTIIKCMNCSVP